MINKYLFGILGILLITAFLVNGCVETSENKVYTIEVSGTNGTGFTGSIGGAGSSRSIEGIIPATYTVTGWPAVAVIQKKEEYGILTVTIKEGDKVINTQTTSAAYGVVTVSSD